MLCRFLELFQGRSAQVSYLWDDCGCSNAVRLPVSEALVGGCESRKNGIEDMLKFCSRNNKKSQGVEKEPA